VPITIKANFLIEDIKLLSVEQTEVLDFGLCGMNERKELKLEITNSSKFPQLIQCTDPENFKVIPSAADPSLKLIQLNPLEKTTRIVFFEPKKAGQYSQVIKYRTKFNQVFEIKCKGFGFEPPVVFDRTRLIFDTISLGSMKTERFALKRNGSPTDLNGHLISLEGIEVGFEIMKPIFISIDDRNNSAERFLTSKDPRCEDLDEIAVDIDDDVIHVWPSTGVVKPGESKKLEIIVNLPSNYFDDRSSTSSKSVSRSEFTPQVIGDSRKDSFVPDSSLNITPPTKVKKDKIGNPNTEKKKGGVTKESEIEAAATPEPEIPLTPFQQKLFSIPEPILIALIPCVSKYKISEEARLESLMKGRLPIESNMNDQSENGIISRTTFMQIEVPIIERRFELIEPKCQKLDFEYVAIGQRKIMNLVFTAKKPTILKQQGLSPLGPFYLVKSLRNIEPGKIVTVPILFEPTEISKFASFVDFSYGSTTIRVQMCGVSVKPELQLEPKERIDMGDVCVYDQYSQIVKISNPTLISLQLQFALASDEFDNRLDQRNKFGSMNFGGKSPFNLSHQRFTIQPASTFELAVKFVPNREHDNFYDYLNVKLYGFNYRIFLTGQGWEISTLIQKAQDKPFSYCTPPFLESPKIEYEKSLKKLGIANETKKEDISPEAILGIIKRQYHFSTVSTTWISTITNDKQSWKIVPIDILLTNLKPSYKIEQGKKGSVAEYTIESVNHTFIYDELLHDYIFKPQTQDSTGIVLGLEPNKGTFEMGTSKNLKLESKQPTLEFWQNCLKRTEDTKKPMKSNPRMELGDCMGVFIKEARVKRGGEEFEVSKPVYMEQCFKIVFKNGFRFVEPKGQQLPIEERTFYLKVKVEPPLSE
jgi:hypothetical protein